MEIVINRCYGGFGLSEAAILRYAEKKGLKLYSEEKRGVRKYFTVPPEQYHEMSKKWYSEDGDYHRINEKGWYFSYRDISRDDPLLVEVIKELGESANARFAELEIIEIPDDVSWEISEYAGMECVAEKHRTWG